MKKISFVLVLIFTFSTFSLADNQNNGQMGTPKSCTNPCLVATTEYSTENSDYSDFVSVFFKTVFEFIN